MYDSREKALMDYESGLADAHEEGRQEGRQEGEAIGIEKGRILLLQEILGVPTSSKEELNKLTLDELSKMLVQLQSKLRDRKA